MRKGRASEPACAPAERERPSRSAGAPLLALQRRAGNRAVTRMVVARRLIVEGQAIGPHQLTRRLQAALGEAVAERDAAEGQARADWQHNVDVLTTALQQNSRLRRWAASNVQGVQYANWGFLEAAAAAAAAATSDAINERRAAAPGPVVQEILNLAHAIGAIASATPLHSAATFSEGREQAFPSDEELALSFALYLEPAAVARTAPGIPAADWATMQREQSRLGVCHETAKQFVQLLGGDRIAEHGVDHRADTDDVAAIDGRLRGEIGEFVGSLRTLIDSVTADDQSALVAVEAGCHSFVIVITPGTVEIVQGFAGGAGYPVGVGLTGGQSLARNAFPDRLAAALLHGSPTHDAENAAMFGGSLYDQGSYRWPKVPFRYDARRLAPNWRARVQERMAHNLPFYTGARLPEAVPEPVEPRRRGSRDPLRQTRGGGIKKPKRKPREKKATGGSGRRGY